MTIINQPATESFQSITSQFNTIQTALLQMADEINAIKSKINNVPQSRSILIAEYAAVCDLYKSNTLKLTAFIRQERSRSNLMLVIKTSHQKAIVDAVDLEGKPVYSNEQRRELALYDRLNKDADYVQAKQELEEIKNKILDTEDQLKCCKIDMRRYELQLNYNVEG